MNTISVRLEKSIIQDLHKVEKTWQADRSEAIRRLLVNALRDWKIETALEKIQEKKCSIGKAAQECNISIWEMFDLVKEKEIDWVDYSKEDLEKDVELIKTR